MEQEIKKCEKSKIEENICCGSNICNNIKNIKCIKRNISIDLLVNLRAFSSMKDKREFIFLKSWTDFIDKIPEEKTKKTFREAKSVPAREQPMQLARAFIDEVKISSLELVGTYPIFKIIRPDGGYVWEMRTKLTRTIGWFAGENKFVAICGGLISVFKDQNDKPKPEVYGQFRKCTEHVVKNTVINSDICRFTQIEQIIKDVEPCA